jgi:hypothetical protein
VKQGQVGGQEGKERKTRREGPGAERRERLNSCRRRISRLRCDHRRRTQTHGRRTMATRSLLRRGRACDSASSDGFTSLECGFCSLRRRRNVSWGVSEARLRERGERGSMMHRKQQDARWFWNVSARSEMLPLCSSCALLSHQPSRTRRPLTQPTP